MRKNPLTVLLIAGAFGLAPATAEARTFDISTTDHHWPRDGSSHGTIRVERDVYGYAVYVTNFPSVFNWVNDGYGVRTEARYERWDGRHGWWEDEVTELGRDSTADLRRAVFPEDRQYFDGVRNFVVRVCRYKGRRLRVNCSPWDVRLR